MSIKKPIGVFLITLLLIGIIGAIVNNSEQAEHTASLVTERVLIPGGQSVGIRMNVKGVLVVGLEEIEGENKISCPAYDAGIQIGDKIISINGIEVEFARDISNIVESELAKADSTQLDLRILRKDAELTVSVRPIKAIDGSGYKMGLWVKEKIAGIGTLSFYDPQTDTFAALGHGIYENRTGALLEVENGKLLKTKVKSVREGKKGKPGEIRGVFCDNENDNEVGTVLNNTELGIYCKAGDYKVIEMAEPMVMATQEQIVTGDAYILTTIDGEKVEKFDIEITALNYQNKSQEKGIEFEVVDKRLLSSSGGIVQGMSGSTIVQNNRIIGAVTHVFLNDPKKGYGIFAEWMVEECEYENSKLNKGAKSRT